MSIYIFSLLVVGIVLLTVTLGSGWISRLPVSYALIYLIVGIFLGPYGINFLNHRPNAEFIERFTEFLVLVSVFSCGLKMNRPLNFAAWQTPARLIGFLMPLSIAAIAIVAHLGLQLDWGAAILLGAILAPTDPVLASEVQIADSDDHDELRFGLTSEGGLNDALAFPFVYFGLYLSQKPNWEGWLRQWLLIDLVWAILAGIIMGVVVANVILWIDRRVQRSRPSEALMEDLVALSTILLTYSLTELINGYGFLAVFVAGLSVRKNYHTEHRRKANQIHFLEQIEKLLEVVAILLLGSFLRFEAIGQYFFDALWVGGCLFFVIRPLGTQLSLLGSPLPLLTRWLLGWFGIRGLGSLYYITYAMGHSIKSEMAERLAWIVYTILVFSIFLHGVTATPLMAWYHNRLGKG